MELIECSTEWRRRESERLAQASAIRTQKTESLLDYFARVNPHLKRLDHLESLSRCFDRALYEPVREIRTVPPQHGKSTFAFNGMARHLAVTARPVLYTTYSEDFATSQMRKARNFAKRGGVPFRSDSRSLREWNLENGGELYATGIGGSITGRPAGLILADDLIKGWREAQSPAVRESTDEWFGANVLTRAHPDTSVIFITTRWHEDDMVQRLIDRGFGYENVPAINDAGEPLWPEERPLEFLEKQRSELGAHVFEALYQGRPRPRGSELFGPATFCDHVQREGRTAIGIDLAYSAKTHADYSVSIVLVERDGVYTVSDVVKKQVQATDFALTLKAHASQWRGAKMRWYCSGTEQGVAQFLKQHGLPVDEQRAVNDKFVRAQPVSAAWNQGKILVPRNESWTEDFVKEVTRFSGVNDPHDDQVDALAAAFDLLNTSSGFGQYKGSGRRMTADMGSRF